MPTALDTKCLESFLFALSHIVDRVSKHLYSTKCGDSPNFQTLSLHFQIPCLNTCCLLCLRRNNMVNQDAVELLFVSENICNPDYVSKQRYYMITVRLFVLTMSSSPDSHPAFEMAHMISISESNILSSTDSNSDITPSLI